jgi:hypothetical protein
VGEERRFELKHAEKSRVEHQPNLASYSQLSLSDEPLSLLRTQANETEGHIIPSSTSRKGENIRSNMPENLTQFILQNWNCQVKVIAITGECVIFIYHDSTWSSTPGLPPLLLKRLQTRPTHLPLPSYVAAGSMSRCYISFDDGSAEWNASEGFQRTLEKQSEKKVQRVAFGRHWNSFFILFDDGTYHYQNIPVELQNLLQKSENLNKIQEIYLGPEGEWFISGQNMSQAYRAASCNEVAKELEGISDIIFGSHGTYLIRYHQSINRNQGR